eukprot:scaffold2267_cov187-Ochromonas_danica.AAC.1
MQSGSYIVGNQTDEYSGYSVSLSSNGSIVAIGSYGYNSNRGRVRVYQYSSSAWTQWGIDIVGTQSGEYSGYSVSLSSDGSIVAIGSYYYNSGVGRVRVYQYSSSAWTQRGIDIVGTQTIERSGSSVSLSSDGSIVAIGSYDYNSSVGRVRVYQYSSSAWTQRGIDIVGTQSGEQSGWSVSLSSNGSIVAIGSYYYNSGVGRVRVYQYSSSAWTQRGIDIVGNQTNEDSGYSVSLSSDGIIVAIGSYGYNSNRGRVRVYQYSSSAWTQRGIDIVGTQSGEQSGSSVSLSSDGSIVAIGSFGYNSNRGRVRVYQYSSSAWTQRGIDIVGTQAIEQSGWSVSLSSDGSIVAIGSFGYNSNRGRVRVTHRLNGQPSTKPSSQPSSQPTVVPSTAPSSSPSSDPSSQPSSQPTVVPSTAPSSSPSSDPSSQPSSQPTVVPSTAPSSSPSSDPSSQPSSQPTVVPSTAPSSSPFSDPSSQPSSQPTVVPSTAPSSSPSSEPSSQPSRQPTVVPSTAPSSSPSSDPSSQPSSQPT